MLSKMIRAFVVLLFFLLPSWGVLSTQVSSLVGFYEIITSVRYVFIFSVIIICFCAICLSDGRLNNSFGFFALLSYLLVSLLHFVGDVEIRLLFDGFRYEVLFLVLAFSIFTYSLSKSTGVGIPGFNFILSGIIFNGLIGAFFAIWQFFNIEILEVLYRAPLEELSHIKLAVGYRLLSTFGNPINFGAFMVLFYIVGAYLYDQRRISTLVYSVWAILVLILILGSLSRLALIAFVVSFGFSFLYKASLTRMIIVMLLASSVFVFSFDLFVSSGIFSRVETLTELNTFLKNARVKNWVSVLYGLEPYQYVWGRGIGASSPDGTMGDTTSSVVVENGFLSVFVQYGILGILLIAMILFRFFMLGLFFLRVDAAFGKLIISFLLFFCVMLMGNDFFRNSPFVFYFWMLYVYSEYWYLGRTSRNRSNLQVH